jgi:hypothetical protein
MKRCEFLSSLANRQKYLYKLVETFRECEDMEDLEGLHHLSSVMKTLSIIFILFYLTHA